MPNENPKYDVAISFLSRDESIASAVYQKLAEGLKVFFYPRSQEELAGTDGLESMREPFLHQSRVTVVLYRQPWGNTPWTRVEETAIKEGCLQNGWQCLFFVVLDRKDALPRWLPQTHVRFNFEDYGLEQAVGAIKARVQESGGQVMPLTAAKRAELFEAEEQFRQDKARMSSEEGTKRIFNSVVELFRVIEKRCQEINEQNGSLHIECESSVNERDVYQTCTLRDRGVGLIVNWSKPYSNSLQSSTFLVREYKGTLILPSEVGSKMYLHNPEMIREIRYVPELSLAREYGWKAEREEAFLSPQSLAERCVIQFVELVSRFAHGER